MMYHNFSLERIVMMGHFNLIDIASCMSLRLAWMKQPGLLLNFKSIIGEREVVNKKLCFAVLCSQPIMHFQFPPLNFTDFQITTRVAASTKNCFLILPQKALFSASPESEWRMELFPAILKCISA